jgi:hypothetical protein
MTASRYLVISSLRVVRAFEVIAIYNTCQIFGFIFRFEEIFPLWVVVTSIFCVFSKHEILFILLPSHSCVLVIPELP